MNVHCKSEQKRILLVLLIAIAAIMFAGCLEPDTGLQDQTNPVIATTTTGPEQAREPALTSSHTPAPDPSRPFIIFDPIGDKKIGDLLVLSGTTNLPEKTAIVLKKTGGNTGDSVTWASGQVRPGTNGINRWRFALDSGGLKPGSYTLTVTTGKNGVAGSAQFSLQGTFLGSETPVYYSAATARGSAGTPAITVEPVGDRQQGEVFRLSGATSLPVGTILLCNIYPAYIENPGERPALSKSPSGITSDTIVIRGTGTSNRWGCALDTYGYEKTRYIVNVSTISEDTHRTEIFGSAQFTLR